MHSLAHCHPSSSEAPPKSSRLDSRTRSPARIHLSFYLSIGYKNYYSQSSIRTTVQSLTGIWTPRTLAGSRRSLRPSAIYGFGYPAATIGLLELA